MTIDYTSCAIIIVAAGQGTRCISDKPKQFMPFLHYPTCLDYVIEQASSYTMHSIFVVLSKYYTEYWQAPSSIECVIGGESRQESVFNGLKALMAQPSPPDYVIIHDAARPYISRVSLDDMMRHVAQHYEAAMPCLLVDDALKTRHNFDAVDRHHYLAVQTPQLFNATLLWQAHLHANVNHIHETHDDIELMRQYRDVPIYHGQGSIGQKKITTYDDYKAIEMIHRPFFHAISAQGFDVHGFSDKKPLILGGIRIDYPLGLDGHSDSDVLLHAITDAILGLSASGDIGQHFSPNDAQWAGADSGIFLQHAITLCTNHNIMITHIDATLIGEEPKLAPYRDAITKNIASLCSMQPAMVSIKATTTERKGFLGRKEGLAAMAHVSAHRFITNNI